MEQIKFDKEKQYGIVLEGGGAKGAYQIGVWKALLEKNIKIKGVAGVSVGALNGALICMGDYKQAEDLWSNISYSSIMDVNDESMDNIINRKLKEISLQAIREDGKKIISDGGFDVEPLKKLIREAIDENKIRKSKIEFIIGTFSLSELKEVELNVEDIEKGKLGDFLMASASLPFFKNEKLDGKRYIDGGVTNNLPIDMLIRRGYKDIIVIRIHGIGIEKRVKIPDDVNVIEISPEVDLGYILEFEKSKANKNMKIGYYDGLRIIESLLGEFYFIKDEGNNEKDYFDKLTNISDDLYENILQGYKLERKEKSRIRMLSEEIYPRIAQGLKLEKNWSYKKIYYSILESCSKRFRLTRYNIYSLEELKKALYSKIEERNNEIENNIIIEITKELIGYR
ncbi:MAG TPA: patatin-like phospholipase family protein [Clostridiales bacterium]|nr:patatin-like phospholipase family protein [Clostridiales bacterium]